MPRPLKTFGGFVGQETAVRTLEWFAEGYMRTGKPVPHLALIGAPGTGKTTLARALAAKLGNRTSEAPRSNFHVVVAGHGASRSLHERLRAADVGDVVLIDEAHALDREASEILFPVIDVCEIVGVDDAGRLERDRFEPVAHVTLVIATSQPGGLNAALWTRVIPLELEGYSKRELTKIAHGIATERGLDLTPQAARELAERSSGTPRSLVQLATVLAAGQLHERRLTQHDVRSQLSGRLGIDEHGLTVNQRRFLRILRDAGGRARAGLLQACLGLDPVFVRRAIEPGLVSRSLIDVFPNGFRQLTGAGRELLKRADAVEPDEADIPDEEDGVSTASPKEEAAQ